MINIGDIVSRNKYNNDILFKVINIKDSVATLEGVNERLCADSNIDDLRIEEEIEINDDDFLDRLDISIDRNNYFYIPGRILHIDADENYLNRCLKFYKNANLNAYGIYTKEEEIPLKIKKYLEDIKPDIVIITGHDAYYKQKGKKDNIKLYKNSEHFEKAVRVARKYEGSYEKLKILAGACQSDYENLIKAGANFASSPKRVNIHALDLSIIALSIALTDKTKPIDLINILNKTKYKFDGIGGIKTYGSMYIGYPR